MVNNGVCLKRCHAALCTHGTEAAASARPPFRFRFRRAVLVFVGVRVSNAPAHVGLIIRTRTAHGCNKGCALPMLSALGAHEGRWHRKAGARGGISQTKRSRGRSLSHMRTIPKGPYYGGFVAISQIPDKQRCSRTVTTNHMAQAGAKREYSGFFLHEIKS